MTAITLLTPGHASYPALLAAVPSPPALYVRGALVPGDALAIAIVGARQATPYGLAVAAELAAELAARGVTIVSGLARGIDTAAHRAALEAGGRTLAVLGNGVDVVYPHENGHLAERVMASGALVSQFAPGITPLPYNFPARNRTLAGLALGVVVVEAAERSGSLITAGFAGDLGREVFAVPGRITSAASGGAHRLIQDGAKLVTCWTDVVQELPDHWRSVVHDRTFGAAVVAGPPTGSDEARMLEQLSVDEPRHIERLIESAGGNAARAGATLIALELGGWARQLEGQRWVAAAAARRG
ncbi:MAG: DNA-processing protein DprA [Candidatus Rokuibacteriota bacterium]